MSDRILITGGAGYIGSELINLFNNKKRIRILDNFLDSTPRNLMGVGASVDLQIGDIRSRDDVRKAMEGVSTVIHLAARTGAQNSDDERETFIEHNVEGTRNIVEAAQKESVEKFVFASSCNLYGYGKALTETDDVEPPNTYAETKLQGEKLVTRLKENGTSVHSLRMATNYGYSPGIRFNLAVNLFTHRALYGEPITIYGDGTNRRPFIHVKDSARAFAHAATTDEFPELVNVGATDQNYQIADVGRLVEDIVDRDVEIQYLKDKYPGPDYHVNFDRLEQTDFEIQHTLSDGVNDLVGRYSTVDKQVMEVQND